VGKGALFARRADLGSLVGTPTPGAVGATLAVARFAHRLAPGRIGKTRGAGDGSTGRKSASPE